MGAIRMGMALVQIPVVAMALPIAEIVVETGTKVRFLFLLAD
jgi:hypothetical protein